MTQAATPAPFAGALAGKKGLILGIANNRSIAWGIAKAAADAGAELALTYQIDALEKRIRPLAAELGATIAWKPILVGGIFNSVNRTVYESRSKPNPLKASYMLKDLADWADLYGLRIVFPPQVFPVNSVKCMRGAFHALDAGRLVPYATAAFEAYWRDDLDISRPKRVHHPLTQGQEHRSDDHNVIAADGGCKRRESLAAMAVHE